MRLINTYDQLKAAVADGVIPENRAVAVSYHACARGRLGYGDCSKAMVFSPFFQVNPKAHWRDQGAMTFIVMGRNWREYIETAKRWASKRFGITEWARNRMGDYVPAKVNRLYPLPKRNDKAAVTSEVLK